MRPFWYQLPLLTLVGILMVSHFSSCLVFNEPYTAVAPGLWRATFILDDKQMLKNMADKGRDENIALKDKAISESELPFQFEIKYTDEQKFYIELINGADRFRIDSIRIGRDPQTAKDTLFAVIPEYDTYLKAIYEGGLMEGHWVVAGKKNYRIPFIAKHGEHYRFSTLKKTPTANISGTWQTKFFDNSDTTDAVGEFTQKDNYLTGTFRTETGDYRFLEGTVQADKLYLSCFDGAHAFLFTGKILPDGSITGSFRSGHQYRATWAAEKTAQPKLKAATQIATLQPGVTTINFSFTTPDQRVVSPQAPYFKDKIKVFQIMGTWCPNCYDETRFLQEVLDENPELRAAVAIGGLSFERYEDKNKGEAAIAAWQKRLKVDWPVAYAGTTDKQKAAAALPGITEIAAYPTLIVMDRKGTVRNIYTGFDGPATSKYTTHKKEFTEFLKSLLSE